MHTPNRRTYAQLDRALPITRLHTVALGKPMTLLARTAPHRVAESKHDRSEAGTKDNLELLRGRTDSHAAVSGARPQLAYGVALETNDAISLGLLATRQPLKKAALNVTCTQLEDGIRIFPPPLHVQNVLPPVCQLGRPFAIPIIRSA
jgi:hypothetical protein